MKKVKLVSGFTANGLNRRANSAMLKLNSRGYEVLGMQNVDGHIGYNVLLVYENGKSYEEETRNQQFDMYSRRFAPFILIMLGFLSLVTYWSVRKFNLLPGIISSTHQALYFLAAVCLSLAALGLLQDRFQNLSLLDIGLAIGLAAICSHLLMRFDIKFLGYFNEYLGYVVGLVIFVIARPKITTIIQKFGWLKRWYDD